MKLTAATAAIILAFTMAQAGALPSPQSDDGAVADVQTPPSDDSSVFYYPEEDSTIDKRDAPGGVDRGPPGGEGHGDPPTGFKGGAGGDFAGRKPQGGPGGERGGQWGGDHSGPRDGDGGNTWRDKMGESKGRGQHGPSPDDVDYLLDHSDPRVKALARRWDLTTYPIYNWWEAQNPDKKTGFMGSMVVGNPNLSPWPYGKNWKNGGARSNTMRRDLGDEDTDHLDPEAQKIARRDNNLDALYDYMYRQNPNEFYTMVFGKNLKSKEDIKLSKPKRRDVAAPVGGNRKYRGNSGFHSHRGGPSPEDFYEEDEEE